MADNLAEALAEDYADAGLATLVKPGSLRALDNEGAELTLDFEQDGDTIRLFENGELLAELDTEDEKFNAKLIGFVGTSLNF